MPIFEYQCKKCGRVRDRLVFRNLNDPQGCICECGTSMIRIMSVPAIAKLADAPPANWQPLKKSKPKSYVPDPISKR